MILTFDCETTGKYDFRSPRLAPHQPRIVQIAAMLCCDDGTHRQSFSTIILPSGFEIPAEATAIHGITNVIAKQHGTPIAEAMKRFRGYWRAARIVVAHNVDFDLAMTAREDDLLGMLDQLTERPSFCTMRTSTNLCRILHDRPRHPEDWKWPKLSEAYKHFFGQEFDGAHDAMADLGACARIFFELKRLGHVNGE